MALRRLILLALMLATGNYALAQTSNTAVDYGNNPAAGKYVKLRGFNMYYETYGQGEPLLIIHGNGGSISNFKNQIPYFAKSYRVILADSRAQGKSVDHTDSLSYEMMTDDLNALLDRLHLKNCYVIGWSDGGINGLLMAIRHPDKVKKLAVTGANLWPDSTAVNPYMSKLVADMYTRGIDSIKKVKTPTVQGKNELKLLRLLGFEPHITTAQLHTIGCPALIIGGDQDVIRPEHTMLIAQNIKQSFLWILPDSGHSTPIYYKDEFNAKVASFFANPYRKREGFEVLR